MRMNLRHMSWCPVRALTLSVGILAASCGGAAATPAPASAPPASVPPPSLTGSIGGRPFAGRSALLTTHELTASTGAHLTMSRVIVYERALTCADVRGTGLPIQPGEHVVQIEVEAPWPVFPSSQWTAKRYEQSKLMITFSGYYATGSLAEGNVRFDAATPADGVLTVQATSMNPSTDLSGSVQGRVPFVVCPR